MGFGPALRARRLPEGVSSALERVVPEVPTGPSPRAGRGLRAGPGSRPRAGRGTGPAGDYQPITHSLKTPQAGRVSRAPPRRARRIKGNVARTAITVLEEGIN